jgi:hypothetical protein
MGKIFTVIAKNRNRAYILFGAMLETFLQMK